MTRARTILPTEEQEQATLAAWLDARKVVWCHVANETGASDKRTAARWQAKRKKLGLKAGVPDVLVFSAPRTPSDEWYSDGGRVRIPRRGVAIELKRRRGGKLSEPQARWIALLRECGWLAERHDGALSAIRWLESLGY